jgi:phage baseplate assembly protein W
MAEPHELDDINRIRDALEEALFTVLRDRTMAREIEAGIDALIDAKFDLYASQLRQSHPHS